MNRYRLGYACINLDVPGSYRTCRRANLTEAKHRSLIEGNLQLLEAQLHYNDAHDIRLFRLSSDIIPFMSAPFAELDWRSTYADDFARLGALIRETGQRVSMHPGQYTVLNSPNEDVVKNAVADLIAHVDLMDALGVDRRGKIVLHIGGAYGDKAAALARFARNYEALPDGVRARLVLENDDRIYAIDEVLPLATTIGAPVVLDTLHHAVLPPATERPLAAWMRDVAVTWREVDGTPKIHLSQQDSEKSPGAHAERIAAAPFLETLAALPEDLPLDIMLEVKDKNRSVLKGQALLAHDRRLLEKEWARRKYSVLAKSQKDYLAIRALLRDHENPEPLAFYEIIEHAEGLPEDRAAAINAFDHVWGYFKKDAGAAEKSTYLRLKEDYGKGEVSGANVRAHLARLAKKYKTRYLLESDFFS